MSPDQESHGDHRPVLDGFLEFVQGNLRAVIQCDERVEILVGGFHQLLMASRALESSIWTFAGNVLGPPACLAIFLCILRSSFVSANGLLNDAGRLRRRPNHLYAGPVSEAVTPETLRARGGLKWTGIDQDVLGAWVAEMDYGLAPSITTALHDAVDRGDTAYFYPAIEGRAAVAATGYWFEEFGWLVEPQMVFPVPDVVEGIRRAIIHLTEPGTPVVLHTPVYFPFFSMVERAQRELIQLPSLRDEGGRYQIDLAGLDRAFGRGAGSIVLCNPWNPTGKSFSEHELDELVAIADSHHARIISDEIHAPLGYEGTRHTVVASRAPETVVTVTSASKAWNLPGLKCGQIVLTNADDSARWASYYTPDKVGVGTFGLIANAAAYEGGRQWLSDVMATLTENRALLGQLIESHLPDVGYVEPDATYLAWLDFSRQGLEDPAAFLVENAGVALTGGSPFGVGGEGHARLNFATYPHILNEVIERIADALRSNKGSA